MSFTRIFRKSLRPLTPMITPASRRTWGSDVSESSIFSLDQLLRNHMKQLPRRNKTTAETILVYKLLTSFSTEDAFRNNRFRNGYICTFIHIYIYINGPGKKNTSFFFCYHCKLKLPKASSAPSTLTESFSRSSRSERSKHPCGHRPLGWLK